MNEYFMRSGKKIALIKWATATWRAQRTRSSTARAAERGPGRGGPGTVWGQLPPGDRVERAARRSAADQDGLLQRQDLDFKSENCSSKLKTGAHFLVKDIVCKIVNMCLTNCSKLLLRFFLTYFCCVFKNYHHITFGPRLNESLHLRAPLREIQTEISQERNATR